MSVPSVSKILANGISPSDINMTVIYKCGPVWLRYVNVGPIYIYIYIYLKQIYTYKCRSGLCILTQIYKYGAN